MWRSIFRRRKGQDGAGFDQPFHVLLLTLSPGREQLRAELGRRGVVVTLIEDGAAAAAWLGGDAGGAATALPAQWRQAAPSADRQEAAARAEWRQAAPLAGRQAITLLAGRRVDGIILDEQAPAAGGKACYHQLAEYGSQHEIPLVWIIKPLIRDWPGSGYGIPANVLMGKVSAGQIAQAFRQVIKRQLMRGDSSFEHYFRGYTHWDGA